MANKEFYFFYAPSWDWPPEGPIQLGNIITSIKTPEQPLFTAPLPSASEIYSTEKTEVEYSTEKLRGGKFSVLTKFLSIFGVGVNLGAEWTNSHGEALMFKRVETKQFIPKEDYLQKCAEAESVRRYMERARYRRSLYLITGVKTVYGSKAKSHVARTRGGVAEVSLDGTVWSGGSAPLNLDPGVEAQVEDSRGVSWGDSSDFVFAFRVRKFKVNKKTEAVDDLQDYTRGAMLDKDGGNPELRTVPAELEISLQEEANAEDEGYDSEVLMEGDDVVHCAVARPDEDEEE